MFLIWINTSNMKLRSANSRLIGEARDRVVRDFDAGGITFK